MTARRLAPAAVLAALLLPAPAAAATPSCSASGPGLSVRSGETRDLWLSCSSSAYDPVTVEIVDAPDHATLTTTSTHSHGMTVALTADAGYVGPDEITIRGRNSDGWGEPSTHVLQIRDPSFNESPTCLALGTPPPETLAGSGVWTNVYLHCIDPNGDAYRVEAAQPAHGLALGDEFAVDRIHIAVRQVQYRSVGGYVGPDQFDVVVRDDRGAVSPPMTVRTRVFVAAPPVFPPAGYVDPGQYVDPGSPGGSGSEGSAPAGTSLGLVATPRLRTALARGLKVRVRAARAGKARVRATLDGRTARKLGLSKRARATTVATGAATVRAGRTRTVTVRFTKRARRALRRTRRVKLTLRLMAPGGKAATRTVTLKR